MTFQSSYIFVSASVICPSDDNE